MVLGIRTLRARFVTQTQTAFPKRWSVVSPKDTYTIQSIVAGIVSPIVALQQPVLSYTMLSGLRLLLFLFSVEIYLVDSSRIIY